MKQPEPKKVQPPSQEQQLRVGIILERDEKEEFSFTAPDDSYSLIVDGQNIKLESSQSYKATCADGQIAIFASDGSEVLRSSSFAEIRTEDRQPLKAKYGLSVDNVIAGRDFHWKKSIVPTLPGNFEIHPAGDSHLVLVNILGFEDYLTCVFASEMGAECPVEFYKAQTIAARCWATAFLEGKHEGAYTLCNDDDCQRYQGTTHLTDTDVLAGDSSRGEYLLTDEGYVCAGYYSKSTGGFGEDPKLSFGVTAPCHSTSIQAAAGEDLKFDLTKQKDFDRWMSGEELKGKGVFCSPEVIDETTLSKYLGAVDESGKYYRWNASITGAEVVENLKKKFGLTDPQTLTGITIGDRGTSGRILQLTLLYKTEAGEEKSFLCDSEYNIRLALHDSFLYSSAFNHTITKSEDGAVEKIDFHGAGWGHGNGLCQIGALGMALKGYSYKDILALYYPGTELVKSY